MRGIYKRIIPYKKVIAIDIKLNKFLMRQGQIKKVGCACNVRNSVSLKTPPVKFAKAIACAYPQVARCIFLYIGNPVGR